MILFMRHIFLACAVLLIAQPAVALSCLRPDAVRLYEFARDSDDFYQIVLGRLIAPAGITLPEAPEMGQAPLGNEETDVVYTPVRLSGMVLTRDAFDRPYDREVTLALGCLGMWCSDPPAQDKRLLFAVRIDGDARFLNPGVCSEASVLGTSGAVDRLLDCHVNNHCPQQF